MTNIRATRPPYVLAHPADNHGCGYHRLRRPLEIMSKTGMLAGRAEGQIWPDEYLTKLKPDVVIWQRQNETYQIEAMERYRRALPNAHFVYEIDDALSLVPEASHHRPYIPIDVDSRIALAAAICNTITVTTKPLADHMRRICGDKADIRLVPNMVGRDDVAAVAAIMAGRRPHYKPRIGWGGGISHSGDLALITAAIEEIGQDVEWVFLGMKPDVKVPIEFHAGVPPHEYLKKLASLDLDLMLAPIEDNPFNRCKSNLRLIEGGMCGYPVIASPVAPYKDGAPPVFAYAQDAKDWAPAIRDFLTLEIDDRIKLGMSLKQWAERFYVMEDHLEDRLRAWMPANAKPFRPMMKAAGVPGITIFCPTPDEGWSAYGALATSFEAALQTHNNILVVRPGTSFSSTAVERMKRRLESSSAASVSAMSNDGGTCGFPRVAMFSPMDPSHGADIDKICASLLTDINADIMFPCGPIMLISRRALNICGHPELRAEISVESSLIEWGIMTIGRGFRNKAAADVYATTQSPPPPYAAEGILQTAQMRWPPVKMDADPLMEARARIEILFHREHYTIPLPFGEGGYKDWAALFDELGDRDLVAMRKNGERPAERLLQLVPLGTNVTIEEQTYASRTLPAKEYQEKRTATDWFVYARDGSTVRAHALYLINAEIEAHPAAAIVYCDHDVREPSGERRDHDFKPTFDHDLLMARDYFMPLVAIRADLVEKATEGQDSDASETAIYRIALGVIRDMTPEERRANIRHIPRILAHIKPIDVADEARIAALKMPIANEHMYALGWRAKAARHQRFGIWNAVSFMPPEEQPLVSIIVPTKDKVAMLSPCISTLLSLTTYKNYEVLIIDNGSTNPAMEAYLSSIKDPRVRIISWPEPYNWSTLNNWASEQALGEYLCFLNDDTRVITGRWLDEMIGAACREKVGAVGARLVYPHGLIQHVGVVARMGLCGHMFKGLPDNAPGYHGLAVLPHEATAVTGACMVIRKALFDEVGRLDEDLAHNFNDVALCLALYKRGYRNVVAMRADLQHIEGATRPATISEEGRATMRREGMILRDRYGIEEPYWNPNLIFTHQQGGVFVSGLGYDMLTWPANRWPWRGDDWPRERVLTIGDDNGVARAEVREGNITYAAAIAGYSLRIIHPPLENTPAWDMRQPETTLPFLTGLGIGRIVVRSISHGPSEILGYLAKLGIPLEYRPAIAEAACPRGDFLAGDAPCGDGWKDPNGTCQGCIDKHGSTFGFVSIAGWRDSWSRFLNQATVKTTDTSSQGRLAINGLYHERQQSEHTDSNTAVRTA